MLRWRLIIGTLLVALLLGLCWLDVRAARPGLYYLTPLAIVLCLLATHELLALFHAAGMDPRPWPVYVAVLAAVVSACIPLIWTEGYESPLTRLGYLAIGLLVGLLLVVIAELASYNPSGKTIHALAGAALAVIYLGGCMGFLVQLRQLPIGGVLARGGMLALFSTIAVTKFTDIGAYFAGHLWGRHKMAPVLSPGKTWEGAVGGLVVAVGVSLLMMGPGADFLVVPRVKDPRNWLGGAVGFGILMSCTAMVGDLAESLLKRDAALKDSSTWLPGFGGVLDMLDSLLLTAPVAYLCWVTGAVGP